MSKLSKQRAKEAFLTTVEAVEKEVVFEEIKNNTEGVDLYTYFVTKDAFKTGVIDDKDLGEFSLRVYSDWYFLHKNGRNKNPMTVKLMSEAEYSPAVLTCEKCLDIIKCGKFANVLPIFVQVINKLEDRFFLCVDTGILYNKEFKHCRYEARLYLNLPSDILLDFAKEFLDKAYVEEFPALLKILNNDNRCDTITIYTDYEYVQKVVDVINEIKTESKSIFSKVGPVSPLLGSVDDYIGFGEQLDNKNTYLSSRCQALSSISKCAGLETLKEGIVAKEKEMIVVKDGRKFTPTQYLSYLIERNAVRLVENKINDIERSGVESSEELERLYDMRDNVRNGLDVDNEVNNLKKSITRKTPYTLSIKGVGEDDYNYVNKLYNLFTTEEERLLRYTGDKDKKNKIKSKLFRVTDELSGVKTKDFLEMYFKSEIGNAIKEFVDREIESTKRGRQSGVINNIRKKSIARLKAILKAVLDDSDDGREYIDDCIYDYVRILSTGSAENITVYIDGREISIDKDVNTDILSLLPELEKSMDELAVSVEFIDKTLEEYGINKDNFCINNKTKNIFKKRRKKEVNNNYYYYNPEGYISKSKEKER